MKLILGLVLILVPWTGLLAVDGVARDRSVDLRTWQSRQADPRRAIRSSDLPLRISDSGSYYLAESVRADYLVDRSITFAASHITLDLMGFTMESGCTVLKAESDTAHIVVQNGTIRSYDCGAIELGDYVQLIDIEGYAGGTATGIRLGEFSRVLRTRGHASDDGSGIGVGRSSVVQESYGRAAEDGVGIGVGEDSLVINSQARAFGFGTGIVAGPRSVVKECTSVANWYAIAAGPQTLIVNSTARSLKQAALLLASGATVRGSSIHSAWIGVSAEGDGISVLDTTCGLGPVACIHAIGSNNRIERNHLDRGKLIVDGSANFVSENVIGGLIESGIGGGAIEVAGARNLIQENTISGAECGILFEDQGGHYYRDNVILAANEGVCGPSNVDGGSNIIPLMSICGDGVQQGNEACDGADLDGHTCISEGLEGFGLACKPTCDEFDFSACAVSICGSGIRRGSEVCDSTDLGGSSCQTLGFNGGRLKCGANCTSFDTSECCCSDGRPGCPVCLCGNGVIDPQEECDGSSLGGRTCFTFGFDGGTLSCSSSCNGFDLSGCIEFSCGNGVREGQEECDAQDFDGMTCQSFAFDTGMLKCSSSCTFDMSGCGWTCGDGDRRGDEVCDRMALNGLNCQDFGFDSGTLACAADCRNYDTGGCCRTSGAGPLCPVCGNGLREAPYELCDGSDLGGESCQSLGRPPGELACNSTCNGFDTSGCIGFLKQPTPTEKQSR